MNSKSSKVIPIVDPLAGAIHHASVTAIDGDEVELELQGIRYSAKIAFSCLVKPQVEDIVMFTRNDSGQNYVLGIIERPLNKDMTIELAGDTKIVSPSGSVNLLAKDSINLMSNSKINCISDQVIHKSREAIIDYQQLTAKGDDLQASYKNIRLFGELMSVIAKQVINRFRSYIRHSEQSDMVKASQMTREVSGLYSMDTKYTIMVSKKDTKIDGERIHMG